MARGSMKNAAKCATICELQDTRTLTLRTHIAVLWGLYPEGHACLRVGLQKAAGIFATRPNRYPQRRRMTARAAGHNPGGWVLRGPARRRQRLLGAGRPRPLKQAARAAARRCAAGWAKRTRHARSPLYCFPVPTGRYRLDGLPVPAPPTGERRRGAAADGEKFFHTCDLRSGVITR